jgi:hypothetical protein
MCCYKGEGICVDSVEAFEYFKLSSDQNYPPAQLAVGFCFELGRGIPPDGVLSRRHFSLAVESGMVIDKEWDHVRRVENPITVVSLSAPLLESDKISLSLATCVRSYFGRVDPWSALASEKLDTNARGKEPRIDTAKAADSQVNLDGLRVLRSLGSGRFGDVKLIEDKDGERYAVKSFGRTWHRAEETASYAFSREFSACCKLRHPCVVPVYGFSEATKQREAALVMEYMENGSLEDVLALVKAGKQPSFWTPTGITIIFVGIVCGLDFIHSKGWAHRDLKPSNFLIDKDGRCYIADLGSSRLLEGATRLSDDKSTMGYTAPELYEREYNWRVDVFSFAMVLYEILVGRAVYAGYSEELTMYLVTTGTRAELPLGMSEEVKSLITRCWQGDPDRRPSFSDILRDLEQIDFKNLPDVDSLAVRQFVKEVRCEQEKK